MEHGGISAGYADLNKKRFVRLPADYEAILMAFLSGNKANSQTLAIANAVKTYFTSR